MQITLEYVAMLKLSAPANRSKLDIADGATVAALLDLLELSVRHQKVIVPFVNEIRSRPDTVLKPGDHVYLTMPVGGG